MTIKNITRFVLVAAAAAIFTISCKKTKEPVPMDGAGQTLVKFIDGGTVADPGSKLIGMKLTDEAQAIEALDLRRDIPNNDELNRVMTVIIKNDPSVLSHVDPAAVPLPAENYTFDGRATLTGDEIRIDLQPGEFALPISFNLVNATRLNLSNTYGLGFTISSVTADGKILNEKSSFAIRLSSNNQWDGIYRLYSGFERADQPGFLGVSLSPNGFYQPYYLITKGTTEVEASINTAQSGIVNSQIIYNAGSGGFTYFTAVAPKLSINPVTNAVIVVPGTPLTAPATSFTQNTAELAASKYYPNGIAGHPFADGRKTIVAHFRWQGGTAPNIIDRLAKDTFVYLQPR
jgi:hypothetical protein